MASEAGSDKRESSILMQGMPRRLPSTGSVNSPGDTGIVHEVLDYVAVSIGSMVLDCYCSPFDH